MMKPRNYTKMTSKERRLVREQYVVEQGGKCMFCLKPLDEDAPSEIKSKTLNLKLFPQNFLKYPIHLHHNHDTNMTEGAVHAYCNGVMWQYFGK